MLSFIKSLFFFCLLTLLTQVGGIIYLIFKSIQPFIISQRWSVLKRLSFKFLYFTILYLIICTLILPLAADKISGRVQLPWKADRHTPLQAANIFTCLMNRHYVDKDVRDSFIKSLRQLPSSDQQWTLSYLDANFPLFDGYPLIPHLSHDDGRKIDIAFLYVDPDQKKPKNGSPSIFGYGVCEEPQKDELNQPAICRKKGYWQYSLLHKIAAQFRKDNFQFDESANRQLLVHLCKQPRLRKIFIEPHLKQRLGLQNLQKIRYHGCHAVRHDDHLHLEF